jgi:hypothetical protein
MVTISASALKAVIKSLEESAAMLKGELKKRKSAVAEEDFAAEASSIKKTVKVVTKSVPVNTVYLSWNGRKPDREPVTLTFLRTASASELYFKGLYFPEYDVDESWTVMPERGRKFRSEVSDYMPGYDIDDVTFGHEEGDLAKPLKVCFFTYVLWCYSRLNHTPTAHDLRFLSLCRLFLPERCYLPEDAARRAHQRAVSSRALRSRI